MKIKCPCHKCGKQFTESGSMKKHIQSFHEKVMFPCDKFYYQATEKFLLKKHVVCPWRFQVSIMIIVDNNLQNKLFLKHIFSLFINVSSILVICVIIKLQQCVVFRNILSLNMKVSSILVINVINNLQGKVISRNIFKHIICRPPWLRVKYSFWLYLVLKTFSHLVQVCKFWIQKHYHKSYIF